MRISGFTGANFYGYQGQSFRFQTLDDNGRLSGKTLAGQVRKVSRHGRQVIVEMYIPSLKCTHTYEAKHIYFKGASTVKTQEDGV